MEPGSVFLYEYDFGDGWTHDVFVEEAHPRDADVVYPLCTGGARACPPEDCGGPPGYRVFLAVLQNRADEDHREAKRWVGGFFDPEAFDANVVNRALRRLGSIGRLRP